MIELLAQQGEPGHAGKPGGNPRGAGGAGGAGGQGGKPGGHGGAGGAGGRGADAENGLGDLRHIAERRQGRTQFVNYLSSILLLILLIWGVLSWWNNRVTISNARIIGESELCGGDWLIVAYDLHVNGTGVLIRDASTQRVSPPKTVIFSESLRYPVQGPIDEQVVIAWQVPREFYDFETGQMAPVPPGEYLRNIAVSSPGRSDVTDTESMSFSIRNDCN